MTLLSWVDLSWTVSVMAGAAVLWRLKREHMLDRFPMLATFLVWDIAAFGLLRFARPGSNLYGYTFVGSRVITWVVSVLVALELVNLITRHYPGIATLARWAIRISLAVAIGVALVSATIDFNRLSAESQIYNTFQLADRTISVSVICFILASVLFLLWFPVRLSRNIVAYALAFVLMYSARVAVLLVLNASGTVVVDVISLLEMLVAIAVYVYWYAVFRYSYETDRVVVGHAWNRTKERRLIQQLESINATVLRATKQTEP